MQHLNRRAILWRLAWWFPAVTMASDSPSGVSGQRSAAGPGGAHAQVPAAAVPTGHSQNRE